MASKTYTQTCSDGIERTFARKKKQGRHASPPELVKIQMQFRTLPATRAHVLAEANKYSMTPSAYIDLAVSLFDVGDFLSHNNCSKS